MQYEMRRRKTEKDFYRLKEIFNLLHHISMQGEELAFDDAVSCIHQLNVMAVTPGPPIQCLNQLSCLPTPGATSTVS